MDINPPKKVILAGKKEELLKNLEELKQFWYTIKELSEMLITSTTYISNFKKKWTDFSMSENQVDKFLERTQKIINSIK